MTHREQLPFIKSRDASIMWSCKIIWRVKKVTSSTTMPVASKHGSVGTEVEGLLHIKSYDPLITWSCEVTCQIKYVIPRPPKVSRWWLIVKISADKAKWSFNYMVSRDRVTNLKSYTSFSRRPMSTKLGKMRTYREKLSAIRSHDPLIVCSWRVT